MFKQTMSKIEAGRVRPYADTIVTLAQYYGVAPQDFFSQESNTVVDI